MDIVDSIAREKAERKATLNAAIIDYVGEAPADRISAKTHPKTYRLLELIEREKIAAAADTLRGTYYVFGSSPDEMHKYRLITDGEQVISNLTFRLDQLVREQESVRTESATDSVGQ